MPENISNTLLALQVAVCHLTLKESWMMCSEVYREQNPGRAGVRDGLMCDSCVLEVLPSRCIPS